MLGCASRPTDYLRDTSLYSFWHSSHHCRRWEDDDDESENSLYKPAFGQPAGLCDFCRTRVDSASAATEKEQKEELINNMRCSKKVMFEMSNRCILSYFCLPPSALRCS